MTHPIRVLLIEDGAHDAEMVCQALSASRTAFEISHADQIASAMKRLDQRPFDVILLDVDLPLTPGLEGVIALRLHTATVPIVVLTGALDAELNASFIHEGAQDCLAKTALQTDSLVRSIRYAIERTARQRAESSLLDSEALYQSLVENLPVCVLRKDLSGRFIFANRAYCEFTARKPEDILGKSDFDFSPHDVADKFHNDDRIVAETGRLIRVVEENRTDDRTRWVEVMKTPVFDARGRTVGTQALFWDVTDRQSAVKALREAKEAAEAASVAKSQFLANMSHEIRTPLNGVLGLTELVLKGPLTGLQREYLNMVRESGESLLSVISDILDFSKIEAGKLSLETEPFELRERIGDSVKSLALRAAEKNLELAVRFDPAVPEFVVGDPYRLRQLIVNLVSNAIKFTDEGEVIVDVGVESTTASHIALHFVVSDTGIGIPDDKLSTIFEAFEQVDPSSTRRFGGTGLGLAISQRLVALMNGRIWVDSRVHGGSRFHFIAEFELTDEIPAGGRGELTRRLTGSRVLVVDDNLTNRRILEEMLRNWGLQPTCASGVHEALGRIIATRSGGTMFDLVVTDVHMPEIDGIAFVELLRNQSDMASIPVILLSSVSVDSFLDPTRCEELNVSACLTKPAKQSELFDAIVQALGIESPEGERPASEFESGSKLSVRPLRILLAEDNWVNRRLGVGLLESWGHRVSVAENGAKAIAAWRAERFDLIVMDVQMPEIDGLQATRMIRAEEAQCGGHIPIIALTAHAMQGDREECLAAGMDEYVAKPLHHENIHAALVRLFGPPNGKSDAAAISAIPASTSPVSTTNGNGSQPPPAVDWTVALKTVQGNRALLRELADIFIAESELLTTRIRESIERGDAEVLRKTAHTLKGSLYLFGNLNAIACAMSLERLAIDGDLRAAPTAMQELDTHIRRMNAALQPPIAEREPDAAVSKASRIDDGGG